MKLKKYYNYPPHKVCCFVGYVSDYNYNNSDNNPMIQNIVDEIYRQYFYCNDISYILVNGPNPFSLIVFKAIEKFKKEFDCKIAIKAIAFISFRKSLNLSPAEKTYMQELYDMADEIHIIDDMENDDDLIVEKTMIDNSCTLIAHNPTHVNSFINQCIDYAKDNQKQLIEKDFAPYHTYRITIANSTTYIKAKSQTDAEKKAISIFYERNKPDIKTEIDDNATPETTLL